MGQVKIKQREIQVKIKKKEIKEQGAVKPPNLELLLKH